MGAWSSSNLILSGGKEDRVLPLLFLACKTKYCADFFYAQLRALVTTGYGDHVVRGRTTALGLLWTVCLSTAGMESYMERLLPYGNA